MFEALIAGGNKGKVPHCFARMSTAAEWKEEGTENGSKLKLCDLEKNSGEERNRLKNIGFATKQTHTAIGTVEVIPERNRNFHRYFVVDLRKV